MFVLGGDKGVRNYFHRTFDSSIPVLGIGGITHKNSDSVINNGAFGVAVIGEILHANDVYQATKILIDNVQYCKAHNK